MTFSREQHRKDVIKHQQLQARILAGGDTSDVEYKTKHPAECVAAQNGQYTLLNKRIKDDSEARQNKALERRNKR